MGDLFDSWPPAALHPAGPDAAAIATLSWVLFAMATAVLALVLFALWRAVARKRTVFARESAILGFGVALPVVVLTALLVYGLALGERASVASADALRIRVIGEQWWWRVIYLENGAPAFETANEIVLPVGRPVILELEAGDVIHSLWVPRLAGKLDMIPGRRNLLPLTASEAGLFYGQCAEYCGGAHALMKFVVEAIPEADFEVWARRQALPAEAARTPVAQRGAAVFEENGCGVCHAIRGTEAAGALGPDLTHLGGRRSIAAGLYVRNRGTIGGWVAGVRRLKPGAKMPTYDKLAGEDLHALSVYLDGLR